jgi:hypothetical protein
MVVTEKNPKTVEVILSLYSERSLYSESDESESDDSERSLYSEKVMIVKLLLKNLLHQMTPKIKKNCSARVQKLQK